MQACAPAPLVRFAARWIMFVVLLAGSCIAISNTSYADQPAAPGVDPRSRDAVLQFFTTQYLASEQAAIDWTGNDTTCAPGSTAPAFRDATLQRINYYRAMAGVRADVTFTDEYNRKAQHAALMMLANGQLDHTPPPQWRCYSPDGAVAAGSSNLSLGSFGPAAIDSQMRDAGTGNYFVGHRRWLLFPQTQNMGTGDVVAANAVWVIDASTMRAPRPRTRDGFVAWPPPGYVPHQVVFPRWSFSQPDADFSQATVTMTLNGTAVALRIEPVEDQFTENTLVWLPLGLRDGDTWPRPAGDTPYQITISNVLIDGTAQEFRYTVTVFDAAPPVISAADLDETVYVPFLRR